MIVYSRPLAPSKVSPLTQVASAEGASDPDMLDESVVEDDVLDRAVLEDGVGLTPGGGVRTLGRLGASMVDDEVAAFVSLVGMGIVGIITDELVAEVKISVSEVETTLKDEIPTTTAAELEDKTGSVTVTCGLLVTLTVKGGLDIDVDPEITSVCDT